MYYRGYQKFLHALLCEDDHGALEGRGKPVKRAGYEDCEFMESASLLDKKGKEIFEGDIVRVRAKNMEFEDTVESIPDMFGSKRVHPLQSILERHGIQGYPQDLDLEVIGNRFEGKF
jgi:hypothetical protein